MTRQQKIEKLKARIERLYDRLGPLEDKVRMAEMELSALQGLCEVCGEEGIDYAHFKRCIGWDEEDGQ